MIRSKGFPLSLSAAHLWRDDAPLKSHYAYQKAKAGDKDAALELVVDLAVSVVAEVLAEVALLEAGRKFNKNNHEKLNVHF